MSDQDPIPVPGPTASKKAVRERAKRVRYSRRQELDDWRALLDSIAGRRALWRILDKAGVFRQVDIESTNRVLVNEGKRSIGLYLIVEIESALPNALELLRAQRDKDAKTNGN